MIFIKGFPFCILKAITLFLGWKKEKAKRRSLMSFFTGSITKKVIVSYYVIVQGRQNALMALVMGLQLPTHLPQVSCKDSGDNPSEVPVGCPALPLDESIRPDAGSSKIIIDLLVRVPKNLQSNTIIAKTADPKDL